MAISTATLTYTTAGPARKTSPPIAGPAMVATCSADELMATAPPKSARGTRFGSSACPVGMLKARAVPNRAITAKIGAGSLTPVALNQVRATSHSARVA